MVPFGQHLICQEIPRAVVCGWEDRGDVIQMLELPSTRNADVHSPRVSRW